jgi:hypothetical protein
VIPKICWSVGGDWFNCFGGFGWVACEIPVPIRPGIKASMPVVIGWAMSWEVMGTTAGKSLDFVLKVVLFRLSNQVVIAEFVNIRPESINNHPNSTVTETPLAYKCILPPVPTTNEPSVTKAWTTVNPQWGPYVIVEGNMTVR